MDPGTGAVIGAGINAGSNVLGNILNWFSGQSANSANRELMREQNQWALQMWQRNNDYNSPQAQMARLRAAGINPALAYSNGMDNTSSAVAETADAPTMKPFQAVPFQMDPNAFAQAEVARAQADLFRTQAAEIRGETPEAIARLEKYRSDMAYTSQLIQESIAKVGLLDEQKQSEVRNRLHIDFEEQMRSAEFERDSAHVAAMIRNLDSSTAKNKADAAYVNAQIPWIAERAAAELLGINLDNAAKQQNLTKGELEIKDLAVKVVKGQLSLEDAVLELNEKKYFANLKDRDVIYRGLNALANIIRLGISSSISAISK